MTENTEHIEWMTPIEVAKYLKLPSRDAVRQAVFAGILPAHKLGRLLRFRKDEIDQLLNDCRLDNGNKRTDKEPEDR